MTKKKESWIVVQDKKTYIYLVLILIGLLKIIFYDIKTEWNVGGIFISLLMMAIGFYLFVRRNTYQELINPDHPHPTYTEKKKKMTEEAMKQKASEENKTD